MDIQAAILASILGGTVGAILTWLAAMGRHKARTEAAVAQAEGALQGQIAAAIARTQQAETTLLLQAEELRAARAKTEELRQTLDRTRDGAIQLGERATRVPGLEDEVRELRRQLQGEQEQSRALSATAAEKAEKIQSLGSQLQEQKALNQRLEAEIDRVRNELRGISEDRAKLKTEAARLPELEALLRQTQTSLEAVTAELAEVREALGRENARLTTDLQAVQNNLRKAHTDLADERAARQAAEAEAKSLSSEVRGLSEKLQAERQSGAEKLEVLEAARETLSAQFKALANDILEEKSKRFAEQNNVHLGQLLDPLRTKLNEFQRKVEEVYVKEGQERSALAEQVRSLASLNHALSEDAKNLTEALKGSSKSQGNWGELILERVLEASGLRKGEEYVVQDSRTTEDGQRLQPDVVINLPEDRRMVVDSKVSLLAYERHVSAENDTERDAQLKLHLDSVRAHIKGLSEKNYQRLYGLHSLDFVLMFMPIEPAFMAAVSHDRSLFMDAWQKNVLLVSPSTLLFVVRTVAHLWRQEAQNRNAQDIASRGAELYDKLCGFLLELRKVGDQLRLAQKSYDEAEKKLATGKGNVIRQAEMLRELGVKPSKQLPQQFTDKSESDAAASAALARTVAALQTGRPVDATLDAAD